MRYVALANGDTALQILRWLSSQGDEPAGLVVHPTQRARLRSELIQAAELPSDYVLDASLLASPQGLSWLQAIAPDLLISISFGYQLTGSVLRIPKFGALNLHPALLPFNRGAYPNVWTIIEGTPAGATLHYIDEGLDTGDIVAQAEATVDATDTGETLYRKLEDLSVRLFKDCWPAIKSGTLSRRPQAGAGTRHKTTDVAAIDRIDPNAMYRAGDLINLLRARTFPPYRGAYFELGDRRIYLRLQLDEARSTDVE